MPGVSFLDPYFYVRIGDAQAKETHIFAAHGGPEAESPHLGRFVTSVTIEEELDFIGKITVSLNPPRDLGLALLDSTVLALGNLIEVRWGYPSFGNLRSAIGMLTIPTINLGREVNITVNAEGLGSSLMRTESHTVWRVTKNDPSSASVSAKEIITKIAATLRLPVEFKLGPKSGAMETPPETPHTQTKSKWLFIRELARKYQARAYMKGGKTIVIVGDDFPERRGAATFRMYGQLDTPNNVFPLLQFNTEQAGNVIGLASRGVVVQDVPPDRGPGENLSENNEGVTATPNQMVAANTTASTPNVGGGPSELKGKALGGTPSQVPAPAGFDITSLLDAPFDAAMNETGKRLHLSARDPILASRVSGLNEISRIEAIEATADVVGVPNIFPDDIVRIEGVGKMFEKNYWITKITHELGSGYDMNLELKNDSFGIDSPFLTPVAAQELATSIETDPDSSTVGVA